MRRHRALALVSVALVAAALNIGAVRRFLNDVEILGTLDVTGETTLGGAVTSSGAVALEGPVSVTRTFTVDPGALDVYGSTRLRGLASADRTFSVPDLSASGNVGVDGSLSVAGGAVTMDATAIIAPLFAVSRIAAAPLIEQRYVKNLASGTVSWDVSSDTIGDVVGAVATRKNAGAGDPLSTNWTGSTVTVTDGSGSSSDAVSVIVWGTPPE